MFFSSAAANASTLIGQGLSQKLIIDGNADFSAIIPLSPKTTTAIRDWVDEQQQKYGTLNMEAYVESVASYDKERKEKGGKTESRSRLFSAFYLFHMALLCTGGMFSLFATGAISERIMIRQDIGESQLGLLNTAYFIAAIIGPYIGGYFMVSVVY